MPSTSAVGLALALDLLLISAITILGILALRTLKGDLTVLEHISLGFPVGSGLLTFLVFLAAWAGAPINLAVFLIAYLVSAGALLLLWFRNQPRADSGSEPRPVKRSRWFQISVAVFAVLLVTAAVIAVGRSHSNYDTAAMWVTKGYGFALEGDLFEGARWGAHNLAYPPHIELLVSSFLLTSGDILPGSQLIFTMFWMSAALGSAAFWQREGVSPWLVGAGLLIVATIPEMYKHATLGFANLPMGVYVALGSVYGLRGLRLADKGQMALGGVLLGLGSWTIIEGFLFSGVCLAILLIAWLVFWRGSRVSWLVSPMALITLVWLVFYGLNSAGQSQAVGAASLMFESIARGDFNLVELRLIFGYLRRYLFRPELWGLLFILGPVVLAAAWRSFLPTNRRDLAVLLALIMGTGLLSYGLFYLRSFDTSDLLAFLIRGFPRQFMATTLMFANLVVLSAGELERLSISQSNGDRTADESG